MSKRAPEPASSQAPAEAKLARQLQALATRVSDLDARSERRDDALQAELSRILAALSLIHDDDPQARRRLRELRAAADYEIAFSEPNPLVSVVIPTWDRVDTLIERSIPSALGQTHTNVEVIVVGDASPSRVGEAIAAIDDGRVRFHNLTVRGPYDEDPFRAWLASGTPGLNTGIALARGLWIAVLGDDDAFAPEHIERLLAAARARRLEFVYGQIRQTLPDGSTSLLGGFPPRCEQIGLQAAIYHSGLRFMELELGHALFGKPNDWGLVHRMMRVGVRIGMVDEISADYWPSQRGQAPLTDAPPDRLTELRAQVAELDAHRIELEARASGLEAHASRLEVHASTLERQVTEGRHRAEELGAYASDLTDRLEQVRSSRSWRLTAPLRRLRALL